MRPDGTVKVLDFGLAKTIEPISHVSLDASASPTVLARAHMTDVGVLLGTAAYMSPEQARGQSVDQRADIWAFGCVLFEMLSGRQAFRGSTLSDTLASVLKGEPAWDALRDDVPTPVRRLLRRCLEKDPKRRLAAIADVRLEIDDALAPSAIGEPLPLEPRARRWRTMLVPVVIGLVAAAAGALAVAIANRLSPEVARVSRAAIVLPPETPLALNRVDRNLAITPDGTRIVYIGANSTKVFVRALDALQPTALVAASGARGPFVSPDSQWVGFVDNTTLKKVALAGGPSVPLATIDGIGSRGATWLPDDTIVFATTASATGLQRVSAAGGPTTILTRPDASRGEQDHLWPEALPGGRIVLFTITPTEASANAVQIAALDLDTGRYNVILKGGSHGQYVNGGHLVYVAGGELRAVRFDPDRLTVLGDSATVVPRLVTTSSNGGNYSVSRDGTLVYVDARDAGEATATPVWAGRSGEESKAGAPPQGTIPRISPDGTRITIQNTGDLWIWDARRTTLARFAVGAAAPEWTPDGSNVIYASGRDGGILNLWRQRADAGGVADRLTTSSNEQAPTAVTPDGSAVIFMEVSPTTGLDIMLLTMTEQRGASPLIQTRFSERNGTVSPNGRWIAYESDESGRFEVYVRPFPNVSGGQWLVSTGGGMGPVWRRDGRELIYSALDGVVMHVVVAPAVLAPAAVTWNAGAPARLLTGAYMAPSAGVTPRTFDITPDGMRLLMVRETSTPAAADVTVVQHWDQELRKLAP